jgi:phosphoribosylaminoimidazolecarboxamide formyltransferase/IMP cyclohydrolase
MNTTPIRRALISVSDKRGIVEFARALAQWQVEILSTGGTFETLRSAGIAVTSVSSYTGFPEILDGRVKTLHPKIHGGLLGIPDNPSHAEQLAEHKIGSIDLLVINLYPFEATIARPGVRLEEAVEQIDIGGPAMLRSAAKNYRHKTVVTNPDHYALVLDELNANGGATSSATRMMLAQEVFARTARYDATIAGYLAGTTSGDELPGQLLLSLRREEALRYGENPHQSAAVYGTAGTYFEKLHGKELSFNNYVDIQAAAEFAEEFTEPAAVIVKHTNPCGAGTGENLAAAYEKALATDSKSAFGGIVAFNRPLDMAAALRLDAIFTEVVIAPAFPDDVLDFLRKKKDRRIIRQRQSLSNDRALLLRHIAGGILVQSKDSALYRPEDLRVVTDRMPTADERAAMEFAWRVAKHVKSNAIVYARSDRTIGVGAGQMSRVDSSRIAALKAQEAGLDLRGTALASDAFFPFADGLLEAVKAGATAVIQPGGSVRDAEVIRAANEHTIAMIFTGMRHFRH